MRGRRDANHVEIVATLRSVGASVTDLGNVGKGCPDIAVGFRGENFLIEIKDGEKCKSAQKLTQDQEKWHDNWKGQVDIASSSDEALVIIGAKGE